MIDRGRQHLRLPWGLLLSQSPAGSPKTRWRLHFRFLGNVGLLEDLYLNANHIALGARPFHWAAHGQDPNNQRRRCRSPAEWWEVPSPPGLRNAGGRSEECGRQDPQPRLAGLTTLNEARLKWRTVPTGRADLQSPSQALGPVRRLLTSRTGAALAPSVAP